MLLLILFLLFLFLFSILFLFLILSLFLLYLLSLIHVLYRILLIILLFYIFLFACSYPRSIHIKSRIRKKFIAFLSFIDTRKLLRSNFETDGLLFLLFISSWTESWYTIIIYSRIIIIKISGSTILSILGRYIKSNTLFNIFILLILIIYFIFLLLWTVMRESKFLFCIGIFQIWSIFFWNSFSSFLLDIRILIIDCLLLRNCLSRMLYMVFLIIFFYAYILLISIWLLSI